MKSQVAVVIPCFHARHQAMRVIEAIGDAVTRIYVVDDACPESTGAYIRDNTGDSRVTVLFNDVNLGVGGATLVGYKAALEGGAEIIVKLDCDGQMDAALIPRFIVPIEEGLADYVKGNRFYDLSLLESMPRLRIFGNSVLSFLSKATTGYWSLMDPTNGFTAIHRSVLLRLPLERLSKRYFFETDMLFRLYTVRAVVKEVPMRAVYRGERSGISVGRVAPDFLRKHAGRFVKRVFYAYFLRDFNIGSLQILLAAPLVLFGLSFGAYHWVLSVALHAPASSGTVMLAGLPTVIGIQFLLGAIAFDLRNEPKEVVSRIYHWMEGEH